MVVATKMAKIAKVIERNIVAEREEGGEEEEVPVFVKAKEQSRGFASGGRGFLNGTSDQCLVPTAFLYKVKSFSPHLILV